MSCRFLQSSWCSVAFFCIICVLATETTMAQSISIGRGGLQLRSRSGQQIHVGRSGVQIQPGNPIPYGQPVPTRVPAPIYTHGSVIQNHPAHFANGTGRVIAPQGSLPQRTTNPQNISMQPDKPIATNQAAQPFQRAAESAFKVGDYGTAVKMVKRAVRKDRQNGALRLFASHVHFATGDYQESADDLELATEMLPPHQWNLVIRNVGWWNSYENYQVQKHRLLSYVNANSDSPEALVVHGFHTSFAGQPHIAIDSYRRALKIDPDYRLANRLQAAYRPKRHSLTHQEAQSPLKHSRSSYSANANIRNEARQDDSESPPAPELLDLTPSERTSEPATVGKPVSILMNGPHERGQVLIDIGN